MGEPIDPVSPAEVEHTIQNLNKNKAANQDGITAEHQKYGGKEIVRIVNDNFNNLDAPANLKEGILTPVEKKGKDKKLPGNYRSIVVTNSIMKIVESILKDRVDKVFNRLQNPLQRGFTESSSSINAAFIISEAIFNAKKEQLFMASLDAQKAFDTVDHNVLFNKLHHLGIQGKMWIFLKNLYTGASVKVKWNNT